MTDICTVIMTGRLTRDADLKYTSAGYAISNFSIAVNESKKKNEQWVDDASFYDVNLYGKTAESLKQYLTKGKQIVLEGRLRQDRWDQDGERRSRIVVIAEHIQLVGISQQKTGQRQAEYERNACSGSYGERTEEPIPENIPF